MQRVTCARSTLRSTAVQNIRLNSTKAPSNLRQPSKKWGDIVIPSREEILEIKAKEKTPFKTDISYLKFESNASLAARLARPTLDLSLARENAGAVIVPSAEGNVDLTHTGHAPHIPRVESPAAKRREARLGREAEKSAREAHRAEKEAKREARHLEKAKAIIHDFQTINKQLGTSTSKASATPPSESLKSALESAAKRKAERLRREAQQLGSSGSTDSKDGHFKRSDSRKKGVFSPWHKKEDLIAQREGDARTEAMLNENNRDFLPEFTGPERISETLSELCVTKTPVIRSGHIVGGNYSRYVPQSPGAFTTNDPDHTYPPTQHLQMVLSHRRDVSIPQRKHFMDIVQKMTKPTTAEPVPNLLRRAIT